MSDVFLRRQSIHPLESHNVRRKPVRTFSTLAIVAVVVARVATFLSGVSTDIDETTYLVLISSALMSLLLLRLDQTTMAAWIMMLGSSAGLFYASLENAHGLMLSVTGYVIGLVLAVMILPGRQWLYLLALDIVVILVSTFVRTNTPLPNWTSQEHFAMGILQICIVVVAAIAAGYLYSDVRRLLADLGQSHAQLEQVHLDLREQTELFEIITANLPVRIAYFDREQNLKFFNKAFRESYHERFDNPRVAQGDAAGFMAFADPEKLKKRRPFLDAVERGVSSSFEMDERGANGEPQVIRNIYVPHVENGVVVGRVSLGIDISELRETQKSLQKNLELFDLVINNVPARIAYIDRSNRLVFVNNRVKDHFGMTAEEVVGREIQTFLPPDYVAHIAPYTAKVYETKQPTVFETPVTLYDGTQIIERSYYYPHIINGHVEALFMLHMDVTEARRTEDSLGKAQKLESLGVLAGGIAHDFNNLLVAMLGQNSLALAKIEAGHPAKRHIVQSIVASERAATLTQQMLAYSGRGAFTIGAINLNELIANNLKLFEVSIPKNVQLVTNLSAELPHIEADTAQMQQLIMNLIINAGQAIGEKNGRVTISTSVETITPDRGEFWEITGDVLVPGPYVSIQVQDDGVGMDQETKDKIFDPFYTTKDEGTGLGLAAALGIIRGHDGGIHLYSEVGHGTVFHLLFPVSDTIVEVVSEAEPHFREPELMHTILVIDDEVDIVTTVADMLEIKGINTIQATRGKDALRIYQQQQSEISLVLLDLMMPGMNGEEVFQNLRSINPDVKVVLSSGYSEAEATRHFIGQGLADFIQKPYDFQTLVSKIVGTLEPSET
ncbi:MAG: response regulator [Candidatus Promineifilaceae bacterium]